MCTGLNGPHYLEYVLRTETRSLGGVGYNTRSKCMRTLFKYKIFPPPKRKKPSPTDEAAESGTEQSETGSLSDHESTPHDSDRSDVPIKHEVLDDGNKEVKEAKWTAAERAKLDQHLRALARWEVEYERRVVRSTRCERMTENGSGICDSCMMVSKDNSLKDAVQRVRTCSSFTVIVSLGSRLYSSPPRLSIEKQRSRVTP